MRMENHIYSPESEDVPTKFGALFKRIWIQWRIEIWVHFSWLRSFITRIFPLSTKVRLYFRLSVQSRYATGLTVTAFTNLATNFHSTTANNFASAYAWFFYIRIKYLPSIVSNCYNNLLSSVRSFNNYSFFVCVLN